MSEGPVDVVALASALIDCESITPARGAVFDVLAAALSPLGFAVDRFMADDVENLLATRGTAGRHLAFAGHVDVVPPGDGWTGDPFRARLAGDILYGRGAVDMKGAVAAFVAACTGLPDTGQVTLIVTGDEEGPAVHGTRALIDRMAERRIRPDLCVVGEPTSARRLGDTVKIGRRGSVNIWIEVPGRQGHVAYPQLADNPIPKLVAALAEIDALTLDTGTDWFQPSNIEINDLEVGNAATNVIPGAARARLSIRFNDLHSGEALAERIRAIVLRHAPDGVVTAVPAGEAFMTPPGALSALVSDAITATLGIVPEFSTTGGTSDARFLSALCPTVEFGLLNATMHKLDEAVAVADLRDLERVYRAILARALTG